MYLARHSIIPPEEFQHDKNIKNADGFTVEDHLQENNMIVPQYWKTEKEYSTQSYSNTSEPSDNKKNFSDDTLERLLQQQIIAEIEIKKQQKNAENVEKDDSSESDPNYYIELDNKILKQDIEDVVNQHQHKINNLFEFCKLADVYEPDNILGQPEIKTQETQNTFAMHLANNKIQPLDLFKHQSYIQNLDGYTVAMILAQNNMEIPQIWQHDKYMKNKQNQTVKDILIKNNQPVPQYWNYDVDYSNLDSKIQEKVDQYCNKYNIQQKDLFQQVKNNDNNDKMTIAMYLADSGIIPPKEFQHKPELYDNKKETVAIKLAKNGIQPPIEWEHVPQIQAVDQNTVALYLAYHGITPQQQWQHNPTIKNEQGFNVAVLLALNKIVPPIQWQVDPQIIYNLQYKNKWVNSTIALILKAQDIDPPVQWYHNKYIRDQNQKTMQDYLISQYKEVPLQWKYEDQIMQLLEKFARICNKQTNDIIVNPQIQNQQQVTFAMQLVQIEDIDVPQEFQHNTEIRDSKGRTVAMIYAEKGKQPPFQWQHAPQLQDEQGDTVAIKLAKQGIIPDFYWQHSSLIKNKQGNTVAFYLEAKEQVTPFQLLHDQQVKLDNGNTVGIKLAQIGIIPSKQWEHDITMQNDNGISIRSALLYYNYIYEGSRFVQNIKTQQLPFVCRQCQETKNMCVLTNCTDKKCQNQLCLECYNNLVKLNKQHECPTCHKLQWLIPKDDYYYKQYYSARRQLKIPKEIQELSEELFSLRSSTCSSQNNEFAQPVIQTLVIPQMVIQPQPDQQVPVIPNIDNNLADDQDIAMLYQTLHNIQLNK